MEKNKKKVSNMEISKKKNVHNGKIDHVLFLNRLKEKSGLKTQAAIAADCGMTSGTLSKKMRGDGLNFDDLLQFYEKYGATPDYLLGMDKRKRTDWQRDNLCKYTDLIALIAKLLRHKVISSTGSGFSVNDPILKYIVDSILKVSKNLNDSMTQDDFDTWIDGFTPLFDSYLPMSSYYGTIKKQIEELQDKEIYPPRSEREIYSDIAKEIDPISGIPSDSGLKSAMEYWDNAPHDLIENLYPESKE